jgi:tetratricopeptide (TPR) repeat protein
MATHHFDAATVEMNQALALEPNSLSINADLCQLLYFKYKFDEALIQCQKTVTMNPDFINAYQHLYEIYLAQEMNDEAIKTYFKINELINLNPSPKVSENLGRLIKKTVSVDSGTGKSRFWRTQDRHPIN